MSASWPAEPGAAWLPWPAVPSNSGATGAILVAALLLLLPTFRRWWKAPCAVVPVAPRCLALDGAPKEGHIVCVVAEPFLPRGLVSFSNASSAVSLEGEVCSAKWLWVHKPTDNATKLESGQYPYSEHMHGRKRLWEMRWQMTFKKPIDGDLFIGIELDRFYKKSAVQRYLGESLKSAFKHASGGAYNSDGDDPERTCGELERPSIVFPLTLIDQLIVTPEGEQPPDLASPLLPNLGIRRAEDRKAFKKAIQALTLGPGATYTFCLWCISQFADGISWLSPSRGPFPTIKFSDIEFHTPGYAVAYKLKACDKNRRESRHLDSRKEYLFRMAFWGSEVPPAPQRVRELVSQPHEADKKPAMGRRQRTSGCCCFGFGF